MSKHHLQSMIEQIDNKGHASAPFHYEKMPYQVSELMELEGIQTGVVEEDSSVRFRTYQIYREKRGSTLDDWLEAEQILKNEDQATYSFINEGNPNAQR